MGAMLEPALGDPFMAVEPEAGSEDFAALARRPVAAVSSQLAVLPGGVGTATFRGFDAQDRPLLTGIDSLAGHLVAARSTVALHRETVGATVVIAFERGDPRLPIIIGVLQADPAGAAMAPASSAASTLSAHVDDQRLIIRAEREIVLQCGDASITLTRAGKVLIQGKYVLSRSSGCNKIKGATIDIN